MFHKIFLAGAVSMAMTGSFIGAPALSEGFSLTNDQLVQIHVPDFTKPNKMAVKRKKNLPPVGMPVRFSIPKLNIDTIVEHIGLTPEGAVGAPKSAHTVSWFTKGPRPGQPGNSVISGHSGIWGSSNQSIFDNLPTLNKGDAVYITDDSGIRRAFKVVRAKVYGKNEIVPEIFASAGISKVNIITCYGTWLPHEETYDRRLVIFTELVT